MWSGWRQIKVKCSFCCPPVFTEGTAVQQGCVLYPFVSQFKCVSCFRHTGVLYKKKVKSTAVCRTGETPPFSQTNQAISKPAHRLTRNKVPNWGQNWACVHVEPSCLRQKVLTSLSKPGHCVREDMRHCTTTHCVTVGGNGMYVNTRTPPPPCLYAVVLPVCWYTASVAKCSAAKWWSWFHLHVLFPLVHQQVKTWTSPSRTSVVPRSVFKLTLYALFSSSVHVRQLWWSYTVNPAVRCWSCCSIPPETCPDRTFGSAELSL